jgi:hypothetical protein
MWDIAPFDIGARWRGPRHSALAVIALCAVVLFLLAIPFRPTFAAGAQRSVTASYETVTYETVEYYDVYDGDEFPSEYANGYGQSSPVALAHYGPFQVIAPDQVQMIGEADSYTPREFRRMLADWPAIRSLHIVDCGGTVDDNANLALARLIRNAGIATHVPSHGSVRSGGVELFLAGVRRTAEPGAEFIVHSWRDNYGREAGDYAPSDAVHTPYLRFYEEVGMEPGSARAFYQLTNSAPHDSMRQLTLTELAAFNLLN